MLVTVMDHGGEVRKYRVLGSWCSMFCGGAAKDASGTFMYAGLELSSIKIVLREGRGVSARVSTGCGEKW